VPIFSKQNLQKPEFLLYLYAGAVPLSFATWQALINNFSIEMAGFTGVEIGILQSLREVPGFLAFAVIFLLLLMREQTVAFVSLLALGIGTALTGMMPTVLGLYFTTVLMSTGYHYAETIVQSLSMQLISREKLPEILGRQLSIMSFVGLFVFGAIYVMVEWFSASYFLIYSLAGLAAVSLAVFGWFAFPHFKGEAEQNKKLFLRKRYWLYYLLTFLSGARRQIFIVFAGFLMVEKFGFSLAQMSLLFLVNGVLTIYAAPKIGRLVTYWGERKTLTVEYVGLIIVFTSYAFVEDQIFASFLYIIDHLFFSMAIALKSYLKKIADPADIASTAGVSFSINHIAAVVLPVVLGLIWISSPAAVFLAGSAIALASLILSQFIPVRPDQGFETVFSRS
jgi:hypothetical protein